MTGGSHEIVIRPGRPFDIRVNGAFVADVREITIPFTDRESAEAAQCEIMVFVRPVHDAGGEDYRPVVAGEVMPGTPAIEAPVPGGETLTGVCRDCRRPVEKRGTAPWRHLGDAQPRHPARPAIGEQPRGLEPQFP